MTEHPPCGSLSEEDREDELASPKQNRVNLDALLTRADLFEIPDSIISDTQVLRFSDLKPSAIFSMLRKPDFQRETDNWTPEQIFRLIETASKGDIIPSVILWQSGAKIFVVDGAHRLSALIAWVQDDYGAGELSLKHYQGRIPEQQRIMHETTKALVAEIGPWSKFENTTGLPLKDIQVQWIKNASSDQAASAFFRINQGGTVIDPVETRILKAKRSALSIATRIITRGGTGHAYWSHFSDTASKEAAPRIGSELYKLLYAPTLQTPIKTTEVPLAGLGYGAPVLRFAFDLVALANKLPIPDSSKSRPPELAFADDDTGVETVRYLKRTKRIVDLVLSNEKHSLGMHPALYFYAPGAGFQSAALFNVITWLNELEQKGGINRFIAPGVRGCFESIIIEHPVIVKPLAHKLGSGVRNRKNMVKLLHRLLEISEMTKDPAEGWQLITAEFPHLAGDEAEEMAEANKGVPGRAFSSTVKSAVTLSGLGNIDRCRLCGGLLHPNGKTLDHERARSAGGDSSRGNARWVHPVCNSNRQINEQKTG